MDILLIAQIMVGVTAVLGCIAIGFGIYILTGDRLKPYQQQHTAAMRAKWCPDYEDAQERLRAATSALEYALTHSLHDDGCPAIWPIGDQQDQHYPRCTCGCAKFRHDAARALGLE